ncbi:DUF4192 domain-containing protein [Actinoplanes flavus]|uniref:DUF4192 domain-containing protein n=1 Tax=Actinoplanes flavus TaxID=2820290 RepID=A0ABS3UFX1_9ACTN|nr:DUF4192 domain-containing protein [Actinoplanes flavus]MBO3736668.1 DUF4192 domain-containing protein [Actinoplanes flavus]
MLESAFPPRAGGSDQLLGLVPYLLGYHPTDALVAIIHQPERRWPHAISLPLNEPAEALLEHLALRIRDRTAGIILIGYGPHNQRRKIIEISEVLRLLVPVFGRFLYDDGVLTCLTPQCDCTPADGIAVDPRSTQTAARMAMIGRVALPSRQDLHTLVAPDPVAQTETQAALDTLDENGALSETDVASLMAPAQTGERLTADQVARLCLALHDKDRLTAAWHQTSGRLWQRELWLDVTRRAPQQHVVAPASLAAWSAWRCGQDALAEAALDRANKVDPADGFARIVSLIVGAHLPAHRVRWPVAQSLDTPSSRSHP